MDRSIPRLHRMAERLFVAVVEHNGFPCTDADAGELAADCYRAAQILVAEGQHVQDAILGAQRGAPCTNA